jgi:Antibiotic biosynthesis monooxygenase
MLKMVEMDENVTLAEQLEEEQKDSGRPIILINKFNVKPKDVDQMLKAWTADAAYLKQKPGFISTQLHRGIGRSCVFINNAVWESVEQLSRLLPAILHLRRRLLHVIPTVLQDHLIYLEKLLCLEFVWIKQRLSNMRIEDT